MTPTTPTDTDVATAIGETVARLLIDLTHLSTTGMEERDARAAVVHVAAVVERIHDHVRELTAVPTDDEPATVADAPPLPTPERPSRAARDRARDRRHRAQLDLLHDPVRFARWAWGALATDPALEVLLLGELPASSWANLREARDLARLAARTPGIDVDPVLDVLDDVAGSLADARYHAGVDLGAVLDQLRVGLLACDAAATEPVPGDEFDAQRLADLRATIEDLIAA